MHYTHLSLSTLSLEEEMNVPTPDEIRAQETLHNKNRQLNRHYSQVLEQ